MKLNVEIKDESQRDELIKQLKGMEFNSKLATSFEKLGRIDGYMVNEEGYVKYAIGYADDDLPNIYAETKQAETAKAYAKLTHLMKQANGDSECKVTIYAGIGDSLDWTPSHYTQGKTSLIKLKDVDTAKHFIKHHQELLETFFQLNR